MTAEPVNKLWTYKWGAVSWAALTQKQTLANSAAMTELRTKPHFDFSA